ncbi:unconventional myosin-Vb-like [Phalacrocorax carbo]|uniref:unconventional myosin-Vb-like n=1 Tax=Phalacrocorax carbo TaxID=9209 RepID=UPI0031194982
MKSCLGQEVEELKKCLVEVEAMKLQLWEEKDALIQCMLEQSQHLEEQHQRVAWESQGLLQELEEEWACYQSLVQEYTCLEQGYENLCDEVAFHRQSTLRWSRLSESFLASESSYLSSMSTAPSRDGSDQQAEGLEECSLLMPEGPQPSGEVLLNGSVGQDHFKKAYLLLLGQLNAVNKELAQTREVKDLCGAGGEETIGLSQAQEHN